MSLRFRLRGVEAGALENNIDTKLAPRAVHSVFFSIDLEGLAVNGDGVSFIISRNRVKVLADSAAVSALSGIIL